MKLMRHWRTIVESVVSSPAEALAQRVAALHLPARVTIDPIDNNTAEVTDLEAQDRGQGQGRATMSAILRLADELGVTLELWPVVDDGIDDGLDQDDLRRWYMRLGFERIPNRDPDDEDATWDRYLVRKPSRD